MDKKKFCCLPIVCCLLASAHAQDLKYSFQGSTAPGTAVTPQSLYNATAGFG